MIPLRKPSGTTFRDLITLMMLAFVVMVVVMLPYLNPPAKNDDSEPPGNVIVHITWPPGNTDIDLWVTGPGEPVAVGYSNSGGLLWNLLRDDLGTMPDATGLNYENAYTRGITPGEYIVNVHCYRCPQVPQHVEVEVSLKTESGDKSSMKVIATAGLDLTSNGQERTAIRFTLDKEGTLKPGSIHSVFKALRNASKEEGSN